MNVFRYGSLVAWSTYKVPVEFPGANYRLFQNPRGSMGGDGVIQTRAESSLMEGGRSSMNVEIQAVGWEVWGHSADRAQLFRYGTWYWEFLQTQVDGSPLGAPPNAVFDLTECPEFQVPELEVSRGITHLPIPMVIPANTRWGIVLHLAQPVATPVDVRFTLFGHSNSVIEILG